jgi:acyl carrier protein
MTLLAAPLLMKTEFLRPRELEEHGSLIDLTMDATLNLPQKLIDYLNESRSPLPPISDPDQPLQIDSLGLIRLVAFLESDLHIMVEDDELLVDNFATGRDLARLINSKSGSASDEANVTRAGRSE